MGFPKADWIWFNGRLVPWDEATVHVTTHALHYGSSVFEGLRAYGTSKGPAIFCLDEHVKRLFNSCKIFRIQVPYSEEEIKQAIIETVRANGHRACYIRPLVFRGSEGFNLDARSYPVEVAIITLEWGRYLGAEALEKGVDVCVSSWRRMGPDTFPAMGKLGGQYINSQFIAMEAHDHGYAEGIGLDIYGYVSEGSGENLFAVYKGIIYTPPLYASILEGITRNAVITLAKEMGYEVYEQAMAREMLYLADELFLTGTAAEITPIRSVDGVVIGDGKRGPITRQLQEEFFAIVEGRKEDRHGWLTYV